MTSSTGDFDLTGDELRVVARFAAQAAQEVLNVFERAVPDDVRPRAALDAAWAFANGGPRTNHQRAASLDAHRAAKIAPTESARLAAQAAGDAAAAAYLHPLAKVTQVGHILRAAANAACVAELEAGDPAVAADALQRSVDRASPTLRGVLGRYPAAPSGKSPTARLMSELDRLLRGEG